MKFASCVNHCQDTDEEYQQAVIILTPVADKMLVHGLG